MEDLVVVGVVTSGDWGSPWQVFNPEGGGRALLDSQDSKDPGLPWLGSPGRHGQLTGPLHVSGYQCSRALDN